jgi:hypothetical protein
LHRSCGADRTCPLATIEIGPCHGDGALAVRLAACLARPAYHIPASSQEDIAAAIGGSAGYVGLSLRPDQLPVAVERALTPGRPGDVAAARDRLAPTVDRHFDTIVEPAMAARRRPAGGAPDGQSRCVG